MTSNQLTYWQLQESKRSNREQERIKDDANVETRRSNIRNEKIKQQTADSQELYNWNKSETEAMQARAAQTAADARMKTAEAKQQEVAIKAGELPVKYIDAIFG